MYNIKKIMRETGSEHLRGDLHCHTRISDGSMGPEQLIEHAARVGLDCVAITDHDSMAGVEAASARAKALGLTLIPGIEVSTYDYKHSRKAHLLCYCPRNPAPLLEFCAATLKARNDASIKMIGKIASRYPIDPDAVKAYASGSGVIYKQHILMALMDRGYSLSVFGELFRELFSSKTGWARHAF
jgi:phosphoribosyl 1,2-cyclic phosphate 1,2-diphosphodiesterase